LIDRHLDPHTNWTRVLLLLLLLLYHNCLFVVFTRFIILTEIASMDKEEMMEEDESVTGNVAMAAPVEDDGGNDNNSNNVDDDDDDDETNSTTTTTHPDNNNNNNDDTEEDDEEDTGAVVVVADADQDEADEVTSSEEEEEERPKKPVSTTTKRKVVSLPLAAAGGLVRNKPPKMRIKLSMRKLPTLANRGGGGGGGVKKKQVQLPLQQRRRRPPLKLPSKSSQTAETNQDKEETASEEEDDDADDKNESGGGGGEEDEDDEDDSDNDGEVVKATVVDSDEAEENDDAVAVATAVAVTSGGTTSAASRDKSKTTASSTAGRGRQRDPRDGKSTTSAKRRAANPSRPLKLPPIASPGLLMVPSSSNSNTTVKAELKKNGYVTAASVFDHHMEQAGYTIESRRQRPHRGSSVKREVGDMFDTNVALSLRFPPLVPPELWHSQVTLSMTSTMATTTTTTMDPEDEEKEEKKELEIALPQLLIESLRKKKKDEGTPTTTMNGCWKGPVDAELSSSSTTRKRKRPSSFASMAPVTLTIPYPEDFVEKRVKYVHDVDARERAIVAFQEAQEAAEIAKEIAADNIITTATTTTAATNESVADTNEAGGANAGGDGAGDKSGSAGEEPNGKSVIPKVIVPPIPDPPSPPTLKELNLPDYERYKDNHPLYPPNGKDNFIAHLDEKCFHITEGRYFGLASNWIADPNFVGPNAPGMSGLNASGGSGLATSTSGGGISGAMALTLSTTYNGTTAGASAALRSAASPGTTKDAVKKYIINREKSNGTKHVGPKPTGTVADLKKIMDDEGGDLARSIKDCIIRAAVHASRSGRHGQSFLAPNGEIYPDVSKAFAAHAGIKPCNRCKSNKQGAYHCRLRRRHKDLDHDGGNSPAILAPLFNTPMDSLLFTRRSSN